MPVDVEQKKLGEVLEDMPLSDEDIQVARGDCVRALVERLKERPVKFYPITDVFAMLLVAWT